MAAPAAPCSTCSLVVEEVARACGVTARIVVEGSLGVVGALAAYGTEAQKRRYFPWVLEDGEKPAIAITEPEAGSAATDLATRADEAPEGWTLGGEKRWITGAGTSRLYLVYCRMGDRAGAEGIGGLLVERDTPGLRHRRARPDHGAPRHPGGAPALRALPGARASRCWWARPTASRSSCAPTTASASARPRWRWAWPRAPTSTRSPMRSSAASSAGPSPTSRAYAGSSPTWRSPSTPRGSSSTAPRARPSRASPSRSPPPRPRPSPPRWRRRSPARRCRSTAPPATAAGCRWSGWCATRACSPSAAAPWR